MGDRENNEGSKEGGGAGSFDSDKGVEVASLEDEGKSEERREKGDDSMCEPDPIGEVVRVLFGEETVMYSISLCNEMEGLDRGVLRDTGQGVKGKGQVSGDQSPVCYKLDDGGEVSSPKGRKWKRMARSQGSKAGGGVKFIFKTEKGIML
ncbi:hypothetical protein ACOSQ4_021342 [Xanthoceras sorbifolium]